MWLFRIVATTLLVKRTQHQMTSLQFFVTQAKLANSPRHSESSPKLWSGGEIRTPDLVRPRHVPSTKLGHSPTTKIWSGWQELNLRGHAPKACGWPLPYTRNSGGSSRN